MPFIGEIAAIVTAFLWALSVVFFRQLGHAFSPLSLNFWKGIISIVGLIVVVFFMGNQLPNLNHTLWLLISGVIGIGVGDTAFFAALNRMGERGTLLLAETLAPIFTALLAIVWISEWLSVTQWIAIGVILIGVDIVVRVKKGRQKNIHFTFSGFSFAALAAFCQAAGAVIGRDILLSSHIDSVMASLVRLIGGLAFIIPIIAFSATKLMPQVKLKSEQTKTWKILLIATFIGTFLAMILQMFSFAHAPAGVVQSLFASCIIFSLLIAKFQGQKIAKTAYWGSIIATLGVGLMFV